MPAKKENKQEQQTQQPEPGDANCKVYAKHYDRMEGHLTFVSESIEKSLYKTWGELMDALQARILEDFKSLSEAEVREFCAAVAARQIVDCTQESMRRINQEQLLGVLGQIAGSVEKAAQKSGVVARDFTDPKR